MAPSLAPFRRSLLREAFVGNPVKTQKSYPVDNSQIPLLLSFQPALFYT